MNPKKKAIKKLIEEIMNVKFDLNDKKFDDFESIPLGINEGYNKDYTVKYENDTYEDIYRVLVLSRNLTFDRSWDVAVCLEGRERSQRLKKNEALSDFISYLHGKMDARNERMNPKKKAIKKLIEEIMNVKFDLNDKKFDDFESIPLGINEGYNKDYTVKYENDTYEDIYRVLVLSRNLTFDRSWDVAVCLEGRERSQRLKKNEALSDFISYLHGKMDARNERMNPKKKAIKKLIEEIMNVKFDLNDKKFDDFESIPLGINEGYNKDYTVKYENDTYEDIYRVLVLSRNLTFDRSWDVAVCLEGRERSQRLKKNEALSDFISYLHGKMDARNERMNPKKKAIKKLIEEIMNVKFDLNDKKFDDFESIPLGINEGYNKDYTVKYENDTYEDIYRVLVLSRNLTFDRSWDVAVCLEGRERSQRLKKNEALSDFISYLHGKMDARNERMNPKKKAIKKLIEEIMNVKFDLNDKKFDDFEFIPLGINEAVSYTH